MARTIASTAAGSNRNKGVLMLALLFGILSAALMFAFLNSKGGGDNLDQQLGAGAGAESVVVVTGQVNAGEKVTSDKLTMRTVPAGALLDGRVTNINDVKDKIATVTLFPGEQVLTSKVTSFEGGNTIAYKVPEGMRALSLQVPHEAWIAGGLPQPGDRVDVLGVTTLSKVDPLTGQEKPDVVAGIIAQNVEVLAVSQSLVKTVPSAAPAQPTAGASGTPAATTTVTPATAQTIQKDGNPSTFQQAISITLALPPDIAAKVAIIDAMEDTKGQYRILPRQQGDSKTLTGPVLWSLEDVFTK